ncbi:endonuclease [Mycoplasma sp. Mirounga ES2805-ORL]|uniref:endonuclease n=1 Tax=Mycoplasma sp. Mirounga ES2805-ORL TaxID=754514 RepID=UPI00197BA7F5|nr:endonuclease [Mycoplasma sp. Mirounga ES2805-ORL]QSF13663.1 endonuclease [Mycoplasma sp. Mirounga ES2805-ORL]
MKKSKFIKLGILIGTIPSTILISSACNGSTKKQEDKISELDKAKSDLSSVLEEAFELKNDLKDKKYFEISIPIVKAINETITILDDESQEYQALKNKEKELRTLIENTRIKKVSIDASFTNPSLSINEQKSNLFNLIGQANTIVLSLNGKKYESIKTKFLNEVKKAQTVYENNESKIDDFIEAGINLQKAIKVMIQAKEELDKLNTNSNKKNENDLIGKNIQFANWTINQDNAFKISVDLKENVRELITGKQLIYDYKRKHIIVWELNSKPSKDEWESAKVIFVPKQESPESDFQYSNISFEFDDVTNRLFLSYKTEKYNGYSKPAFISNEIYKTIFNLNPSSKTGLDDNAIPQTNNTVKETSNEGSTGGTTTTKPSVVGDVYSNLVAPSIKTAKEIKYESSDFYDSLEGKSGTALIRALRELQAKYRNNTGGYNDLYKTYEDSFVDRYYENNNQLLCIYAEVPSGKDPYEYNFSQKGGSGREGNGWNREHIIAQSWFGKAAPMRNDAHHVWPTDATVNGKHGNFPYGNVKTIDYKSQNGTIVGTGYEDGQEVVEVINEFKGDVARAHLYFALTYYDKSLTGTSGPRFFEKVNGINTIKEPFLKTMLEWAKYDPITQFDLDRNNGIYKHQHNRNPFSDYPELIDVVFGNNTSYVFHNHGFAKELIF